MKVRTLEELSAALRDDLAWRRKELRVLEWMVNKAEAAKQQAVLRGAIASLYAHWEGYIRFASRAYYEYVRTRRLNLADLSICFVGVTARGRIKTAALSDAVPGYTDLVEWLIREWPRRANMPQSDVITTRSNLNSEVFKEIVATLGIPYHRDYLLAEKTVIDPLVAARNRLAHGEWELHRPEQFMQDLMLIDRLVVLYCEELEDAAIRGAYRRDRSELI